MSGIILVRDVMAKNVKTVRTDDSVLNAVMKMNKFRIGSVIVTINNKPVGIITERNIMERIVQPRLDPGIVKAKDIMSSPLVTVDSYSAIEEAAKIMADKQVKTLPVLEEGKILGVITTSDVVRSSPTLWGILEELLKVG